jgi:hypothetical protein
MGVFFLNIKLLDLAGKYRYSALVLSKLSTMLEILSVVGS